MQDSHAAQLADIKTAAGQVSSWDLPNLTAMWAGSLCCSLGANRCQMTRAVAVSACAADTALVLL